MCNNSVKKTQKKQLVNPHEGFQSQHHGTSRQVKIPWVSIRQREATAGCRAAFGQQHNSFPLFSF